MPVLNSKLVFLGTQGWDYPSWKPSFYGEKTPRRAFLEFYSRQFDLVEINSTRHGIPRADSVKRWRDAAPDSFVFSAKFPDTITHDKLLVDAESETIEFLTTMGLLGEKLGPLLLEFAPSFKYRTAEVLARYLGSLPRDFRYAVEVRDESWLNGEFYKLLAEHNVALTLTESSFIPRLSHATTDFTYIRLLGRRKDVPDDHYERIIINRNKELNHWADLIYDLNEKGIAAFCVINNHFAGHSPKSVRMLEEKLRTRIESQ